MSYLKQTLCFFKNKHNACYNVIAEQIVIYIQPLYFKMTV